MANIAGVSGLTTNTQTDQLTAQYKTTLQKPVTALTAQKTDLTTKNATITEMQGKLNDFATSLSSVISDDRGKPPSIDKFEVRKTTSSDSTIASATTTTTATSNAAEGSYTVQVNRLATRDTIYSNQVTSDDVSIVTAEGSGAKSFTLTINGVATVVNVTLDGGDTNKTVIQKIVAAIKSSGANVQSQTFSDTATTSRLLMSSKTSGKDNAITFADVSGTLLSSLGLTAGVSAGRTVYGAATAGYQINASADLDASFKFNNVDLTRSSNTISDLLDGTTLTLSKVSADTVTITTSLDTTSVASKIQDFVKNYNTLITYMNSKVSPGATGGLAGDPTYTGIRNKLASIVTSTIDSITTVDGPDILQQIGISLNKDHTLTFSNQAKFNSYMEQNPQYVGDLFVSTADAGFVFDGTEGVAYQLKTYVNDLTKFGGRFQQLTDFTKSKIRQIDSRVTILQAKIDAKVLKFQTDFATSQSMLQTLTTQTQQLNAFFGQNLSLSNGG